MLSRGRIQPHVSPALKCSRVDNNTVNWSGPWQEGEEATCRWDTRAFGNTHARRKLVTDGAKRKSWQRHGALPSPWSKEASLLGAAGSGSKRLTGDIRRVCA